MMIFHHPQFFSHWVFYRFIWNSCILSLIFWIILFRMWIRFSMIILFSTKINFRIFSDLWYCFWFRVILLRVTLVVNLYRVDLSSIHVDKREICWGILVIGLILTFLVRGAICFDVILQNVSKSFQLTFF